MSADTYRGLLSLAGYSADQLPAVITRTDALKVPALSNGVTLFAAISNQLPLKSDPPGEADYLLAELDPDFTPGWTISQTVLALLFYGQAWWVVMSRTARGFPRTVRWVDNSRVMWDVATNQVRVDGTEVPTDDVIRFDGIIEGLLARGSEAIRTALANVRQTRVYATNPAPAMYLTDAEGAEPLEADEAIGYLQALTDAVKSKGTAYLAGLNLNPVGWTARELQLVEARQLDAVEMARLLAVPTRYVAAPAQGDSLTYANLGEVRRDLLDVGGLSTYLVPFEQRLSMPDVTPRGTRVRFDADSVFLRITPDQADPQPAQNAANQMGAAL